jgi:hypothetical protein
MLYAVTYDTLGNRGMYAAVQAAMGADVPDGLVAHLVVAIPDGLRHTSIWASREAWERFRSERVEPAVRQVLARAGIPANTEPPVEDELDLVDLWAPDSVPWTSISAVPTIA